MIAKIDVNGEEELSVNVAKNRIIIFEKTDMQSVSKIGSTKDIQTKAENGVPKRGLVKE